MAAGENRPNCSRVSTDGWAKTVTALHWALDFASEVADGEDGHVEDAHATLRRFDTLGVGNENVCANTLGLMRRTHLGSAALRSKMVERDIVARGVRDKAVLSAMRSVPREAFVDDSVTDAAYEDRALPIGEGQTISQPLIVAVMAEAAQLSASSRVLEVGAGSGYGAAVLGRLASEVWTIERHERLADVARVRLESLGFDNVHVVCGDGTLGLADKAPFDAIVVTAAALQIPGALQRQLVDGGQLVIPVGPAGGRHSLLLLTRRGDSWVEQDLGAVRFVPLIA